MDANELHDLVEANCSLIVDGDTPVLQGLNIKAGNTTSTLFRHQRWNLAPGTQVPTLESKSFILDFNLPPAINTFLKEYTFARMHTSAGGMKAIKPQSVASYSITLLDLFGILDKDFGVKEISQIDQDLLNRWLLWAKRSKGLSWTAKCVSLLGQLVKYQEHFTTPLKLNPWAGASTKRVVGVPWGSKSGENLTPRIPEAVAGPILIWSLRYTQEFASEIIDALGRPHLGQRNLAELRRPANEVPVLFSAGNADCSDATLQHVSSLRQKRYGSNSCNDEDAGSLRTALVYRQKDAQQVDAFREVLASRSFLLEWEARAQTEPEALIVLRRSSLAGYALARELRMLATACYILVAHLSGMRDSEVQGIRRGALLSVQTKDGVATRWKVRSRVYKGRRSGGVEEDWVLIGPSAHALTVMEAIHVALGSKAGCYVFRKRLISKSTATSDKSFGQNINRDLNQFIEHVNVLAGRSSKFAYVPNWNGSPWRLAAAQFRRTLAWYIANRPFGTIAGKIQFKQLSVQTFEGYAGNSASGFLEEVEQERLLEGLEVLETAFHAWSTGDRRFVGPGSAALVREFESLSRSAPVVADDSELREYFRHRARNLYPGMLSDCHFDPAKARCGGKGSPHLDRCMPTECANSLVRWDHRVFWLREEESISSYLNTHRRRMSAAQREILKESRSEIRGLLAQLGGEAST